VACWHQSRFEHLLDAPPQRRLELGRRSALGSPWPSKRSHSRVRTWLRTGSLHVAATGSAFAGPGGTRGTNTRRTGPISNITLALYVSATQCSAILCTIAHALSAGLGRRHALSDKMLNHTLPPRFIIRGVIVDLNTGCTSISRLALTPTRPPCPPTSQPEPPPPPLPPTATHRTRK